MLRLFSEIGVEVVPFGGQALNGMVSSSHAVITVILLILLCIFFILNLCMCWLLIRQVSKKYQPHNEE